MSFDHLWERYIARQRQLEEGTVEPCTGYYDNHVTPFCGGIDIGLIRRQKPVPARADDEGVRSV